MSNPQVLIVAATWPEIGKTCRAMKLKRLPDALRCYARGTFGGCDITALVTGMGAQRMSAMVIESVESGQCDWLLCVGFAGALNPSLNVGDVLIPKTLLMQNRKPLLLETGQCDQTLLTVDHVVTTPQQKQQHFKATGADAVDMESRPVIEMALDMGLHVSAVRVISDDAKTGIPQAASGWIDETGTPKIREPMMWMFSGWSRFQTMRRMIKDTTHAAEALAKTIPGMIRQWASSRGG